MTYRLATIAAAFLLLIVGFLAVGMMTDANYVKVFEPTDEDRRAAAAYQLNRGLPRDLGNGTRLEGVTAVSGGIQFQFTMLEFSGSEIDPAELHDFVYETSRNDVCSNPQLLAVLVEDRMFVEAQYRANDGGFLTSVRIDQTSCREDA